MGYMGSMKSGLAAKCGVLPHEAAPRSHSTSLTWGGELSDVPSVSEKGWDLKGAETWPIKWRSGFGPCPIGTFFRSI